MYVCMYAWYLDEHVRRNTQPAALIYSACTLHDVRAFGKHVSSGSRSLVMAEKAVETRVVVFSG